jgi:NDP-sugar pyrophosphorylase family protein
VKAAILAAGLGERFRRAGIATPKPLLQVGGRTLLERAILSAARAGATEAALIVNAEFPEVERFARTARWPVPVQLVVRTTPNSMESFFALEPHLRDEAFLLLTVDSVHRDEDLRGLAAAGAAAGPLGTLGVTDHVDDEKPLYVRFDETRRIAAIGPAAAGSRWITSGLYFFFPGVYERVAEARSRRLGALREFLALLVERGERLFAHPVGTSIDVDRPEDLAMAEAFLRRRAGGEDSDR